MPSLRKNLAVVLVGLVGGTGFAAVTVEPPPADQVTDISNLAGAGAS